MVRDVVTFIWCDFHLGQEDIKVEAEELPPITIGNAKPRMLALCKEHRESWYEPMREAVAEFGTVVDGSSPAKSVITPRDPKGTLEVAPDGVRVLCPECKTPLKNRNTVQTHMRAHHGITLKEWEAERGPAAQPADPSEVPDAPKADSPPVEGEPSEENKRRECPECGEVFEWPTNTRPPQALGLHRAKKHGVPAQGRRREKGKVSA